LSSIGILSGECRIIGDYVSVREDDGLHTFQVASVEPV
jgi:hypothetical protein